MLLIIMTCSSESFLMSSLRICTFGASLYGFSIKNKECHGDNLSLLLSRILFALSTSVLQAQAQEHVHVHVHVHATPQPKYNPISNHISETKWESSNSPLKFAKKLKLVVPKFIICTYKLSLALKQIQLQILIQLQIRKTRTIQYVRPLVQTHTHTYSSWFKNIR